MSLASREPLPEARTETSRWLVLVIVCLAQFMVVLDATIVNVALPSIQADLGFSRADLQHPAGKSGEHLVAVRADLLLHALAEAIEEAGEDRMPDGSHARTLAAPRPHRLAPRSVVSSTGSGPGSPGLLVCA